MLFVHVWQPTISGVALCRKKIGHLCLHAIGWKGANWELSDTGHRKIAGFCERDEEIWVYKMLGISQVTVEK